MIKVRSGSGSFGPVSVHRAVEQPPCGVRHPFSTLLLTVFVDVRYGVRSSLGHLPRTAAMSILLSTSGKPFPAMRSK